MSGVNKTEAGMSLVTKKPVFGVCDQVRLKPACSPTEASYSIEISDIASTGIILNEQQSWKLGYSK